LAASPLAAQTAVPDEKGHLVFKANARTVVLDVVVTGRDGHPVPGLTKEDFLVSEDGQPQRIASFEEHTTAQASPLDLPDLPPNIFTNIPRVTPTASVTVLLLDSLNTPIQDQSLVRSQSLKYLRDLPPGRRMAVFTLGSKLRYVLGFSTDSAVLSAAVAQQTNNSGPQTSPLLRSSAGVDVQKQALALIANSQGSQPSAVLQKVMKALDQYQHDQAAFANDQRVRITLDALQQLAHYLAGIPGRKNVVWFSGAFPLNLFMDPKLNDPFSIPRDYQELVRQTDRVLAEAEVAMYPVAAAGLSTQSVNSAEHQLTALNNINQTQGEPIANPTPGEQILHQQLDSLQDEAAERNSVHTTMEMIADDTGGEAIYNANELNAALARVVDHGSRFYTLAYTPGNTADDGRFRKVRVILAGKSASGGPQADYKLAYRHGYFAAAPKAKPAVAGNDPLHPFMGPGMPECTQIAFAMRVRSEGRADANATDDSLQMDKHQEPAGFDKYGRMTMATRTDVHAEAGSPASDNPRLRGTVTRYAIDMVVAAGGLQLEAASNGSRKGSLEATLIVYDQDGKPLNWIVRQIDLQMSAERYAQAQANGVSFALEIDAPKTAVSLRSGLYDMASSLAGTMEIPLAAIANPQPASLKTR
jgi:VWFA-related protein